MSKIKVPDGMVLEASKIICNNSPWLGWPGWPGLKPILEAALAWLAENPIVPSVKQMKEVRYDVGFQENDPDIVNRRAIDIAVEWQRRMFLAPEPNLIGDEEIGAFVANFPTIEDAVREAYELGKKSAIQSSHQL